MNRYTLQNTLFPDPEICDVTSLYYRGSARFETESQSLIADNPAHIDLHTYFNVIPAAHYREHFGIKELTLDASFSGTAEFLAYAINIGYSEPKLLAKIIRRSNGEEIPIFDIDIQDVTGYVYFTVNTHTPQFKLKNISASCLSHKDKKTVGIVICTFKREAQVRNVIRKIGDSFRKNATELSGATLYVINNDKESSLSFPESAQIKHIFNENLGGAGGFTRGMIEAIDENKDFVILCDDDIVIHEEIIRRSIIYLSLMSNPKMGLHGAMLELEFKSVLHEIGELFDPEHRLHINERYGNDMTDTHQVKIATIHSIGASKSSNMFGWWFTAIPTSLIKSIGLPMPYFVSGDDLEYSLRLYKNGFRAFISPTISVWHPSHMTQHAPLRTYFISRNRLALLSLHTTHTRVEQMLKIMLREAYHMALSKRYATADAICKGLEDYLSGPGWYYQSLVDWRNEIRWIKREQATPLFSDEWLFPINGIKFLPKKEPIMNLIFRKLTLGGHIFTSLFHVKTVSPQSPGNKSIAMGVAPINQVTERVSFRSGSILYYDDRSFVGFHVWHNNSMFFRVLIRIYKIRATRYLKLRNAYNSYLSTKDEVTTIHWWRKRLGI